MSMERGYVSHEVIFSPKYCPITINVHNQNSLDFAKRFVDEYYNAFARRLDINSNFIN